MGYIYLITNLINNKKYIGQTNFSIEQRWKRHKYEALILKSDLYFHKAIRKYGPDNFLMQQLEECSTDKLDEREIHWIDYYKSYYIYKEGYNLTRGGSGNLKANEQEIMKLWNQGYSAIEIARQFDVYIRTITNILKNNSVSQQEIYSRSMKYGAKKREKKIYQYDMQGKLINIYDNLNDMQEKTKYNKDYISAACRHTYPSANGYIWIYEDDEIPIEELLKDLPQIEKNPVLQYDCYGNLLNEFDSFSSAAKALNLSTSQISRAAKNDNTTAGGYFWIEKNSNINVIEKIEKYNKRYNDREKSVEQYDKQDNYITTYKSITEAAKAIGKEGSRVAISRVCKGQQKTSCGFIWKYKISN